MAAIGPFWQDTVEMWSHDFCAHAILQYFVVNKSNKISTNKSYPALQIVQSHVSEYLVKRKISFVMSFGFEYPFD